MLTIGIVLALKINECLNVIKKTQELTFWDRSSSVWDGSFWIWGWYYIWEKS